MKYRNQLPVKDKLDLCYAKLLDPSKFKEDNVRHYVLILLGLDALGIVETPTHVDWASDDLWIEFKKAVDYTRPSSRAIVVGQMLQYLNKAQRKGIKLPKFFAIADNDEFIGYRTENFMDIYSDKRWFLEGSASKVQENLVDRLMVDADIITRRPMRLKQDYDKIIQSIELILEPKDDLARRITAIEAAVKELEIKLESINKLYGQG